ncbi:hypothetical protein E8F11_06295 [Pseudomonas sp. BN417]|uniref:hypothetical protein n=1 Tax=Pseudomonas sp. BN417 TaxID=2567890 RepID=UPI0024553C86|nr:hypothetical protein [Pseudomonas sp. BN417]MDH4554789.1 hypothetical protein [Pseudomonas sp. BN417]
MISAWNLKELRDRIRENRPVDGESLVEITNSLGRSREIFEYHKKLARDAFEAFNTENDPTGMLLAEHVFGVTEKNDLLTEANLASEANLIACISVTRNAFDSFGQLLNGLVVPEPCTGNFYIHDVLKKLPAGELKDQLKIATSSAWYEYMQAFTNIVKHRQLIKHNSSLSFVEDRRGGKVNGFKYKGKDYTDYWVRDVLQGTVEVQNSLVTCGRALNRLYI